MSVVEKFWLASLISTVIVGAVSLGFACSEAFGAEDLKLRPGVSFTQDIDSGFPILASKIDDVSPATDTPTCIFFGASGDLNTNRQAKRLVDLYKKVEPKTAKFIILDVDHATTDDAKKLIKTYYKGYIPFEVILDKTGKTTWSQIGEVDTSVLKNQLEKAQ